MFVHEPALTHQTKKRKLPPGTTRQGNVPQTPDDAGARPARGLTFQFHPREKAGGGGGETPSARIIVLCWADLEGFSTFLAGSSPETERRSRHAGRPRASEPLPPGSWGQKRLFAFIFGCIRRKLHFEGEDCLLFKRGSLTGDGLSSADNKQGNPLLSNKSAQGET